MDAGGAAGATTKTMTAAERKAFHALEVRLRAILPETYQRSYEEIEPVSMGSAGLKFDGEGKVAWNEMWATFCDLAMAGGPPHKGVLLEPGTRPEVEAQPARYAEVTDEICRGIALAADLAADPSPQPGWVRVQCYNEAMAGWLLRAIVMENVSARRHGTTLDLPAAPGFRLEKEIKNVITVIAKTSHYWLAHMRRIQRQIVGELFAEMQAESPLVEPVFAEDGDHLLAASRAGSPIVASAIQERTGLRAAAHGYAGWLGLECASVRAAVWMMRLLVVSNVLARREGTVLFVPLDPVRDPDGAIVSAAVARVHRFAAAHGVI